MTKLPLYIAPVALVGLMPTGASAAPPALSSTIARDIAAATDDEQVAYTTGDGLSDIP